MPLTGQPVPTAVARSSNRILLLNADVIFMTTVPECKNWLGELSNTVMRASTCELLLKPAMGGISYAGLWDLGYFLTASMSAPIGYIQDHLGYFRAGGTSNSSNLFGPSMKGAILGYAALALGGQRTGQLSHEQVLKCCGIIASVVSRCYTQEGDMEVFCTLMPELATSLPGAEDRFLDAWVEFQAKAGF